MDTGTLNRRQVLKAAAVSSTVGLAGCGGGDDGGNGNGNGNGNGDGDMGERVPEVLFYIMGGLGDITSNFENISQIARDDVQELGLSATVETAEVGTVLDDIFNDNRNYEFANVIHTLEPRRLDPSPTTTRYRISWAGSNGLPNINNFAHCEFTEHALASDRTATQEDRLEELHAAHTIMHEEVCMINTVNDVLWGAANTNRVDPQAVGSMGYIEFNPKLLIESEVTSGDQLVASTTPFGLESTNFPTVDSGTGVTVWNRLVNSTLVGWDENMELQNVLAESVEQQDEGTTVVIEIADATFHNGDPITAEDAQWTYQWLQDNTDDFPKVLDVPYESIEVVDDRTIQFNFEEPQQQFLTSQLASWGVLHSDSWIEAGAEDDPTGFQFSADEIIGSGPYAVSSLEEGNSMALTPHDGHPTEQPAQDLFLSGFAEDATKTQAFLAGEIDITLNLTTGSADRVRNEMDAADVQTTKSPYAQMIGPNHPKPPTSFREFREAVAMSLNRNLMNQQTFLGESDPQFYGSTLASNNTFFPEGLEPYTEDPTGDKEGAQQLLEDNGWVWDDDDNLRYPADASLDPLWPEEGEPADGDFPCVNEDNEFTGTS
jgi:peptide/nickel transport system substrate-binding protein